MHEPFDAKEGCAACRYEEELVEYNIRWSKAGTVIFMHMVWVLWNVLKCIRLMNRHMFKSSIVLGAASNTLEVMQMYPSRLHVTLQRVSHRVTHAWVLTLGSYARWHTSSHGSGFAGCNTRTPAECNTWGHGECDTLLHSAYTRALTLLHSAYTRALTLLHSAYTRALLEWISIANLTTRSPQKSHLF